MKPLLRAIARRQQNPRAFWVTRLAVALLCWGLWYHDMVGLAVGAVGIVLGLVAFREADDFTTFSARAVVWQAALLQSWQHTAVCAVAAIPIIWGLWDNNPAWIAIGLLAWLTVTWHFAVRRFMPADARAAFAPPTAAPQEAAKPNHNELAFP